jgi:hypothetical protein
MASIRDEALRSYPVTFHRFSITSSHSVDDAPLYFCSGFSARLVHSTVRSAGFLQTDDVNRATLMIGTIADDTLVDRLRPTQRMTHFRHTHTLGSKVGLHCVLESLSFRLTRHFTFYPRSFLIPRQLSQFRAAAANPEKRAWIEKPVVGSCGRGIRIVIDVPDSLADARVIMQEYIRNPLLIRGHKFDLRFYVAVPSIDPLRIYLYRDGLVRLAADPYCEFFDDFSNLCAHLTNFSVNKMSTEFKRTDDIAGDGEGNKWSLRPFWPFVEGLGYDGEKIRRNVADAIVTVMMAARDRLRAQANHRCSFELYGIDILLDADGKIHLLEFNVSPALGTSSALDLHVKEPLVRDFLDVSLVPVQGAVADRIEHAFASREREEIAGFITVVEMEIAERQKGAFERVYPTPERVGMLRRYLEKPSQFDELLAKYVRMSRTKQQAYFTEMVPLFDDYVEDLVHCDAQSPMCQVA